MPHLTTDDGMRLYYEEVGSGVPIVFVHEFAGDSRSWESQVRHFGRRYRCITYNARGYPPSDVPDDGEKYSQAHARDDAIAVLDHLKIDRAHVVGLSMGGFAALHVGITYPQRARSLVIGGCGYGAEPDKKEKFRAECEAAAASFESNWAEAAKKYALGPTRVQFQNKDPRGWAEFARQRQQRQRLVERHIVRDHVLQQRLPLGLFLALGLAQLDIEAIRALAQRDLLAGDGIDAQDLGTVEIDA